MQAWRTAHEPKRGIYTLGTQPLVHKGFYRAWQAIQEAVLEAVDAALRASTMPTETFRMYLTGMFPRTYSGGTENTAANCV